MRLVDCCWSDVEAYLKEKSTIVMPVGSTEQHGPTGKIGTDAICAESIALEVGKRMELLVGPTLWVGMAMHHLAFPGTLALRPTTLTRVFEDIGASLGRSGFTRCFVVNGHGGNAPALLSAFSTLHETTSLQCKMANWWKMENMAQLIAEKIGDADGYHATVGELSVVEFVTGGDGKKHQNIEYNGPVELKIFGSEDFRKRYPDGRMGSDVRLVSPELGETLLEAAVQEICSLIEGW